MKEKTYNKSKLVIFLSFLVPVLIMAAAYEVLEFWPFGKKSVLIMDMGGQYAEFFTSLRYIGKGDNTLFFSWSRSMGGNFVGLVAYYIASPLSFLTLFFSVENIPAAMWFLTLLKIGLCGLTFAVYLEYTWNERKGKAAVVLFSSCYALMSYTVVYSMCLMWLDGVILLPVVLLGVEKLLQGRKGFLYLLSLTALFICNYYTGYMIGIFTAMYIVYRAFCLFQWKDIKKVIEIFVRFAANTLLAIGLSAPLLLTTVKELSHGRMTIESYIPEDFFGFSIYALIKRFFGGEYSSITNTGLPSIFCGLTVLALVAVFFFLKRISWKEKLGTAVILCFLIASFWMTKLDLAWHGFSYPAWFPYRYAFLFSAFMILTAYRAYMPLESSMFSGKKMTKLTAVYLMVMIAMFQCVELHNNIKENLKGLDGQFGYKNVEEWEKFVEKYEPVVERIQSSDDSFYRMEKDVEFSKNDAMMLGYNGMTHFSSTFHAGINTFTRKLGLAQTYFWNSGYGSTPLIDSLLNVKYRMMEGRQPDAYEEIDNINGIHIYQNTLQLPIAFASEKMDKLVMNSAEYFENQNLWMNALAGTTDVKYLKKLDYTCETGNQSWQYVFTADSSNPVYIRIMGDRNSGGDIYVNGDKVGSHFTSETNCSVFLGQFEKGEEVTVVCKSQEVNRSWEMLYELDMDALQSVVSEFQKGGLDITKQKGSTIEGKIMVGKNQMIFTSIPYDEGYTVKVDGKKTNFSSMKMSDGENDFDVFLIIPASEGEHTIAISYMPPGFMPGMLIFAGTIILILLYYRTNEIQQLFFRRKAEEKQ